MNHKGMNHKGIRKRRSSATRMPHVCETCDKFTPIGEGDHICEYDPQRMPVSDYIPTEDYFWCRGRHYVSREEI